MQVRTGGLLALAGLGMTIGGGILAGTTDGAAKKIGIGLAAGGTALGLGSLASGGRWGLAAGIGAVGAGALLLSACGGGGGAERPKQPRSFGGRDGIKDKLPGMAPNQDPSKVFSSVNDITDGVMLRMDATGDGKIDFARNEYVPTNSSIVANANWKPGDRLTDKSTMKVARAIIDLEVKRRDGQLPAEGTPLDTAEALFAHAITQFGSSRDKISADVVRSYVGSFDENHDGNLVGEEMTKFRTAAALYAEKV